MNNDMIISLTSILLVIISAAQISILIIQNRQSRLQLINDYRRRWLDAHKNWGEVVFIGRNPDEYYHVIDEQTLNELKKLTQSNTADSPTIWARNSIQVVCGLLNEVSLRILQGQLYVADAYPIFGTELLRHSSPLRILLDTQKENLQFQYQENAKHLRIRNEIQDWLIYHDGIRRRCLILIDLLWAEAVRLEDLPPDDITSAADSKTKTGHLNRNRVYSEVYRLKGLTRIFIAFRLYYFLYHSEYCSIFNWVGISKKRLQKLNRNWTKRLLLNNGFSVEEINSVENEVNSQNGT
jgi:hypothetical protein